MRSLWVLAPVLGLWLALEPAVSTARAEGRYDLLRLTSGRSVWIRPGWEASFEEGFFWFEYVAPRHLACQLPLEDVVQIEAADGTIYENTYEPPPITYSTRAVLNVYGTIVENGRRTSGQSRERRNSRGWNSRTGRYDAP